MTDAVIEFAKWVIQKSVFDDCYLNGWIVQEMALELGLLTKTKYDPEKHGEDEYTEPGADWYVFSNLLTQTALSPAPELQEEPHEVLHIYEGDGGVVVREIGNTSTFGTLTPAVHAAFEAASDAEAQQEPLVRYSDYAALEAQLATLSAENERLRTSAVRWSLEASEYAKKLDKALEREARLARPAEQAVTEAMVERAFRDGIKYATICKVSDIDEAWRTSAVRAALKAAMEARDE